MDRALPDGRPSVFSQALVTVFRVLLSRCCLMSGAQGPAMLCCHSCALCLDLSGRQARLCTLPVPAARAAPSLARLRCSCPHGMPERKMGAAMGQDCEVLSEVSFPTGSMPHWLDTHGVAGMQK